MSPIEDLLKRCTVKLTLPDRPEWGTGFFVATGWILTCNHVVREAGDGPVRVRWGAQENWAEAYVEEVRSDPDDLALLRVRLPEGERPPCVGLDEAVRSRDPLYLFGYPDQDFPNGCPVTFGCEGWTGDEPALIKFALGQVRPGMSGSPLLNQRTGMVCGMVKFTRDRSFDLGGGAISTRVILEQFPQLRELQVDRRWSDVLAKDSAIDFRDYLGAIAHHYQQWWRLYTLTDAEGRQAQAQQAKPFFDFGLMVQTVSPKDDRSNHDEAKEKIGVAELRDEPGDQGLAKAGRTAVRPYGKHPINQQRQKIERFTVLDGLQKYAPGHVLLVGRPGSGKSTALARLMLERGADGLIPVLVELRSWQSSVLELIRAFFQRHELVLSIADIQGLLGDRKLLLLIDGVNELPSEAARTDVANFRRNHPKVPMIFTTRDLSLGGDLGIEKKLEMQPLTETQMQAFVQAYIPEKAEAMLRQLKERLRDFGKTPLLLWMLCEVFDQTPNQQLPNNLAEIFRLFTRMYADSSVRKHEVAALKGDVRPLSDRRLWKPALMHLASVMMEGKERIDFRVVIDRSEAERALQDVFSNESFPVRDILDDLLNFHLLQYRSAERIEFQHQLIQEYYAAEWLLGQVGDLNDDTLKRDYLNYLKWTEPVALMLALVDDEALAVPVVKLALDVDLMLGARLAGEVRSTFQEKTIEKVIAKIKDSQALSWLEIEILAYTGSLLALPQLLNFLDDCDLDVATRAVSAIDVIGDITAVPHLIQRFDTIEKWVEDDSSYMPSYFGTATSALKILDHNAVKLKSEILKVCSVLAPEEIKSRVVQHIKEPSSFIDSFMQHEINRTFASFSKVNIEPEALQILESCTSLKSVNKLSQIAELLAKIKSKKAVSILVQRLNLHEDSQYRNAVIQSLGDFDTQDAAKALSKLLIDPNESTRRKAAEILIKKQYKKSIPFLIPILDHKDFYIRWGVSQVLGEFGESSALQVLSEGLTYENHRIRAIAARLLGNLPSEGVIPLLLQALNDSTYSVRRNAAISLAAFLREEAIPELFKALRNYYPENSKISDLEVVFYPVENYPIVIKGFDEKTLLENIGDADAVHDWALERNSTSLLQEKVVEALSQFNTHEVRGAFRKLLQENNRIAAIGLARLGELDVAEDLIELLKNPRLVSDTSKISNLLVELAEMNHCEIVPEIISLLTDVECHVDQYGHSDYYFRNRLVSVLAKIRHSNMPQYLPRLLELLSTDMGEQAFWIINAIQFNCKFYNYEIFYSPPAKPQPTQQSSPATTIDNFIAGDYIAGDKIGQDKILGYKTAAPNATEVKIFEQVDNYHETPPRDPPS